MNQTDVTELFVKQLTEHQPQLYGYVYSLLGDHARSADVVQETNLVLWRKIEEFDTKRPFLPWAFAIARFQVLAHLRDNRRDRLLLDEELALAIVPMAEQQASRLSEQRDALRPCLQQLAPASREMVKHRYLRAMSIDEVATVVNRSVGAVKVALLRSRRQLADCVRKKMALEGER